ncbi:MAG: hypothetical protein LBE85_07435 [Candidatus Accumulibacter sp.]|jgi:hypothetical protein|nr:hypothetical protein [Accumulibacter sp.]
MKKLILSLTFVSMMCIAPGCGPRAQETKMPDAKIFLDRLPGAVPVTDEENKVGLYIENITKSKGDYVVDYRCTNKIISGNSNNMALLMTQIYFIDPESYENHYQPFTIKDGKVNVVFEQGDEIGYPIRRIKFEPPSKIMYMYFSGIEKGGNNPPELATVPLFFTLVLGDNPQVFERTPRHAGNLFDEAIKKTK